MFRPSILLVRHGETDDNANRIFQGQKGKGLNARGREQAKRLGARLAALKLSAIYSSDLDRARETAEAIAGHHGLVVGTEPELREVDVGAWTGLSHDQIADQFPEEWASWQSGIDVRRGGGETYAELGERMMRALDRIARAHGEPVVAVSHGGAIRSVLHRVLGHAVGATAIAPAENTSITLLDHDARAGTFRVTVYNDTHHLEDAIGGRLQKR